MTITFSPRWKLIATLVFGITMLGSLIAILQSVHQSIHQENQCQMTFMWRRINMIPIVVPNNTVKTYGLYRYHEGDPSGIFFSTPSTIPVLFVPGSGGSANQVRSIGSVMQNKTELRSLPYRFHFYSIDFNEELTFLSGHTVKRQRDFVIKSISAVLNVYKGSEYSIEKLVLIGHSFGGSIVLSLAAEDFPTRTAIDLILMKASPINAPPIMMDNSMRLFYLSMSSTVENTGNTKLDKVAIVSWSGGLKDYQISDGLSKLESSSNSMQGVYFPLWALDDVRMDTDHLCILWCNQFVKHESRLLQAYAENWISKDGDTNAHDVINKFYMNQLAMPKEVLSNLSPLHTRRVHPLLWPWDNDMYDFTSDVESSESVQYFTITSETPETVLKVELKWYGARCKGPTEMYFQFTNGFRRHAVVPKKMKTMTFNVPQTLSALEPLQGKLVIKAKTDCNFNVKFSNNFFWSIYMMFLVYSSLIPSVILDASLCLAAVSLGLDRQLSHSTIIIATNAMLALHLGLAFSVGTGIRFATLHLRMFIVYFIFAFTIVEPIKRSLNILFSPIMRGSQLLCRLFWLLFIIGACLNPHISLGFLLVGLSMLSKSSPSFIGGICGAAIQIGIGLAGGVRDAFFTTPLFLYIQEHLVYALPFWTCLLFVICSIFEVPRKLLSNHKSCWLLLPVTALLFTFISEKVPLEAYACFMVIWLYFNNVAFDLPKPVKEKANSTARPRQWNDKYKKL